MPRQFYAAVLPATGRYALFLGDRKQHLFFDTLDALALKTEMLAESRRGDIYFATCTLGDEDNRKAENALLRNTLCFDIDAGKEKYEKHGDTVYETARLAADALAGWCASNDFIPHRVVSSGNGLHVYFKLDRDLTQDEWKPLAEAVKAKALADGLRIDAQVTGDFVRILRPVGTLHKSGKPVRVLRELPQTYSPEEVAAKFPAAQRSAPGPAKRRLNDEILSAPAITIPRSIHKIVAACAAMGHVANAQGDVPEPYWRAALGVAKHTVEGVDAAHLLSRGHPEYDAGETEVKFHRWTAGPSTCETFAGENPSACASCPHRGKIKSPIVLGSMEAACVPAAVAAGAAVTAARYVLQTAAQLMQQDEPAWLIKGMVPARGIGVIYAPPNCGKSFFAGWMARNITTGIAFCGRRVRMAPVVIFSLEGRGGIKKRAEAMERAHGPTPDSLRFITTGQLNIRAGDHLAALAASINEEGLSGCMVVIDTLAAASAGADENSAQEMGLAVAGINWLAEAIEGSVVLVHHTGKDVSRGMRGSSVLLGAVDWAIEISRDGPRRTWTLRKSKDGADGASGDFGLRVIELGTDDDGDPITSCVVTEMAPAPSTAVLTGLQQSRLTALALEPNVQLPYAAAVDRLKAHIGGKDAHRSAHRTLADLIERGALTGGKDDGWVSRRAPGGNE
ncbi:AAA family ATPase [Inhella sp.]|uniref:AAA family ATPase n=1 Tax=Inhella sp. TaxID=1921806 RepID=UPI0035B00E25